MTNSEEVPRVSCSIGTRQGEPPVPEQGLVHVFSLQQATLRGLISASRTAKGLTCGGCRPMTNSEEVLRVSYSIGTRQGEPPAPQNGLVHVFSRCGTIP